MLIIRGDRGVKGWLGSTPGGYSSGAGGEGGFTSVEAGYRRPEKYYRHTPHVHRRNQSKPTQQCCMAGGAVFTCLYCFYVDSRPDVRGPDRVVPPLVVDVQREVALVHDADGHLLRLHGREMVASAAVRSAVRYRYGGVRGTLQVQVQRSKHRERKHQSKKRRRRRRQNKETGPSKQVQRFTVRARETIERQTGNRGCPLVPAHGPHKKRVHRSWPREQPCFSATSRSKTNLRLLKTYALSALGTMAAGASMVDRLGMMESAGHSWGSETSAGSTPSLLRSSCEERQKPRKKQEQNVGSDKEQGCRNT